MEYNAGDMEIIGHRGAGGLAPENSIEAIRKAIALKLDMIELDVRVQEGTAVLSHDQTNTNKVYCPLSMALKEIASKTDINLEIKERRALAKVAKLLKTYPGKVVISSFRFNILKEAQELLPNREIAVIENWSGIRAVATASLLQTKRLHIKHQWLWAGLVKSLKHQGYKVYAYTINDKKRAQELQKWGVNGIFTDYPNRFLTK